MATMGQKCSERRSGGSSERASFRRRARSPWAIQGTGCVFTRAEPKGNKLMGYAVYMVQQGIDGPVKIGMAIDVDQRIADLQVGNGERLYLRAKMLAKSRKDAHRLESKLHHIFWGYRLRGEWFQPRILGALWKLRDVEVSKDNGCLALSFVLPVVKRQPKTRAMDAAAYDHRLALIRKRQLRERRRARR